VLGVDVTHIQEALLEVARLAMPDNAAMPASINEVFNDLNRDVKKEKHEQNAKELALLEATDVRRNELKNSMAMYTKSETEKAMKAEGVEAYKKKQAEAGGDEGAPLPDPAGFTKELDTLEKPV
jgi:hypothetical protein